MLARAGTYALVMTCTLDGWIGVGKLGRMRIEPGFYVYAGSAFGPGGLKARIAHHMKLSARPRWHIDYLRPSVDPAEIWFTYDSGHREHQWAGALANLSGASVPVSGFGASDCRCKSHLYFFNFPPNGAIFRHRLHAAFNPHEKIFIKKHLTKMGK